MNDQTNHSGDSPRPSQWRRIGFPRISLVGLFLIPLALVVYVIALPLFGLFWLIEWLLPMQSQPVERRESGQFGAIEIAPPPQQDSLSP